MIRSIINRFRRQKLSKEAFDAYFYRLPESITVKWERDGKMIVGRVSDGSHEFVTQGHDAEEFVEMVNDAVYTVHGIPSAYMDVLRGVRSFAPSAQEQQKLADASVSGSTFPITRNEQVLKSA